MLLVGGLNTVFGYGVFALALWLGLHYSIAAAIATVFGVLFNFNSMGSLVFGNKAYKRLPIFIGVYALVYIANVAVLWILGNFGVPPWLGGGMLLLPSALLSYFLNYKFVFKV